jgi:hypothetical protein
MNLIPARPPGSNARKARAFACEIRQLRDKGYTFEAIREALAAAGIHVSNSTVQREVARTTRRAAAMFSADAAASLQVNEPKPVVATASVHASGGTATAARASSTVHHDQASRPVARRLRGKEDADAFFSLHHNNPLLDIKESP